jgi:DnaJ-class molecular chaperone
VHIDKEEILEGEQSPTPKLRIKIPCMSCNGKGQSININGDYLIDDCSACNGFGYFEE